MVALASRARAFQQICRANVAIQYPSSNVSADCQRCYATQTGPGANSKPYRRAITVTSDDGRYHWSELSTGEKAARSTQQSFNFLLVTAGAVGTVCVAYLLYQELFAADSKTRQFNQAVDRIKADPKCRELLGPANQIKAYGEPTTNKWARARPLAHTTEIDRLGTTHFKMHFHVEGPEASGVVNIRMTKKSDESELQYKLLSLSVPGHQVIYLENADAASPKRALGKMFGVQWRLGHFDPKITTGGEVMVITTVLFQAASTQSGSEHQLSSQVAVIQNMKPHIVLIPGAWHTAECYDTLLPFLQDHNYQVTALTLPSVGAEPPLTKLEPEIAQIRNAITSLLDRGEDVVVVMHSYGGLAGTASLKGFSKTERQATNQPGGVTALVYLAAWMLDEGQTIRGSGGGRGGKGGPSRIREDGDYLYHVDPIPALYQDVDRDLAEKCASKLCHHSLPTLYMPLPYAAWKHIPSTYLFCTEDQTIVYERQVELIEHARKTTPITTFECNAGHSPFLSQPELTAKVIRHAAGEKDVRVA